MVAMAHAKEAEDSTRAAQHAKDKGEEEQGHRAPQAQPKSSQAAQGSSSDGTRTANTGSACGQGAACHHGECIMHHGFCIARA